MVDSVGDAVNGEAVGDSVGDAVNGGAVGDLVGDWVHGSILVSWIRFVFVSSLWVTDPFRAHGPNFWKIRFART